MKTNNDIPCKFLVLLLLFGTIVGCSHQQVVNSPCTTLNATFDIKPRTDLALAFGNDAIKAAVEAVVEGFSKGAITSVSSLTDSGKDAAVKTAKANGKTPSSPDISELANYLSRDVVPTIKQHPTCNFTVSSVGKPYIGIEQIALREIKDKQIPTVWIKNTGQMEANCHVALNLILGGKATLGNIDLRLGPNQTRSLSLDDANLPMADIEAGKISLLITVAISYPLEAGGAPITSQETWRYEHGTKHFSLASQE